MEPTPEQHAPNPEEDFPNRHCAVLFEGGSKRLALDIGHRIVENVPVFAGGQKRYDVGVLKLRSYLDLVRVG